MSRKPSEATLLKAARAQIKDLNRQLDRANLTAHTYRERATKAEQEVADWRKRFDILLARDPRSLEGLSGSASEVRNG